MVYTGFEPRLSLVHLLRKAGGGPPSNNLYQAKVMAITDYFQEFLRIVFQEISKIQK
jgi:hypothetical protein